MKGICRLKRNLVPTASVGGHEQVRRGEACWLKCAAVAALIGCRVVGYAIAAYGATTSSPKHRQYLGSGGLTHVIIEESPAAGREP